MEIGSFIELQFAKGKEWYSGEKNIARLNTGRAAIYHAMRILGCTHIYIPFYQCHSVGSFLRRKGVIVKLYKQDKQFNPLVKEIEESACILLVNYFGIMSCERMEDLARQYKKTIIDNSQAFFAKTISDTMNVYSARKFVGVPDGAYVIGESAENGCLEYEQGFSSDTSLFLLQRIEYGCEGKTYQNRKLNEERIDLEDIKRMSVLTRTILDSIEYKDIIKKRRQNFDMASELFKDINGLDTHMYYDASCVPMVYPLYVENDTLLSRLLEAKHFQGNWWQYILDLVEPDTFEYKMSKYMIPITIDQRYGRKELEYLREII